MTTQPSGGMARWLKALAILAALMVVVPLVSRFY
jgi:hypothetical protein